MVKTVPLVADSMNTKCHSLSNYLHCVSACEKDTHEIRDSLVCVSHIYILRVQPEPCTGYKKKMFNDSMITELVGSFLLILKTAKVGFYARGNTIALKYFPMSEFPTKQKPRVDRWSWVALECWSAALQSFCLGWFSWGERRSRGPKDFLLIATSATLKPIGFWFSDLIKHQSMVRFSLVLIISKIYGTKKSEQKSNIKRPFVERSFLCWGHDSSAYKKMQGRLEKIHKD